MRLGAKRGENGWRIYSDEDCVKEEEDYSSVFATDCMHHLSHEMIQVCSLNM